MAIKKLKKLQNAVERIRENKPIPFETAVTIYMIKANCTRDRAVEIVKKSWEQQEEIDRLIPQLELAIRMMENRLREITDEDEYNELMEWCESPSYDSRI